MTTATNSPVCRGHRGPHCTSVYLSTTAQDPRETRYLQHFYSHLWTEKWEIWVTHTCISNWGQTRQHSASLFQFSQVSWGGGGGSFSTTLSAFLCFLLVTLLTTPKSGGGLVPQLCSTLVTPWTVAHQVPLSWDFSRQEYWRGLPFPTPWDLPNPGTEPRSPTLQADSLPSEPLGKPC